MGIACLRVTFVLRLWRQRRRSHSHYSSKTSHSLAAQQNSGPTRKGSAIQVADREDPKPVNPARPSPCCLPLLARPPPDSNPRPPTPRSRVPQPPPRRPLAHFKHTPRPGGQSARAPAPETLGSPSGAEAGARARLGSRGHAR